MHFSGPFTSLAKGVNQVAHWRGSAEIEKRDLLVRVDAEIFRGVWPPVEGVLHRVRDDLPLDSVEGNWS